MSGSRPVRKPRRFIVKVQLSFFTSEPCQQMLVYDEKRRRSFQGDVTEDVLEVMRGRPKAFFWATFDSRKRVIGLDEEAPWQRW